MPSKKRKYNARFPAGRIKKIMQTDEEVGKVAQAVPVIISRTLELFVESLLNKALEVTTAKNAKTLSTTHMKQCILSESRFDFLKDLVKNIPDINNDDNVDTPTTPNDLNQQPVPPLIDFNKTSLAGQAGLAVQAGHAGQAGQAHCSNERPSTVIRSPSESSERVSNLNNVQIQAAVNTSYSANFYAEQSSDGEPRSVIQYNQKEAHYQSQDPTLSRAPIFHISSNIREDTTNDNIPPLIPIRQPGSDNPMFSYCSPSDNLCIDEDYDN